MAAWRNRIQWPKLTRDTALLLLGMYGFVYEVTFVKEARPEVILGALALMGVPLWLRADEARKNGDGKNGGGPSPNGEQSP